MIMSSKLRAIVLPLVLGAALAGCTGKEPGNATAGESSTAAADGSAAPPTGGNIGDVEPCSLLKSDQVAQLKLSTPEALDRNSCQWRDPDRTLVRVNTYADKGVDDVVPGPNSEVSRAMVGKRDAKLLRKALSSTSCVYSLPVTGTSRVDVFATASTLDAACAVAKGVAEAIESNLP